MTRHPFRQPAATGPLVRLKHGFYELVVAPAFGARIVSFRYTDRDILRPTPEAVLTTPRVYEFAGFPLMPYSGPLFGPGFSFAGFAFALDRTVREEPTATHGDAWISSFRVLEQNAAALTLEFDHEPQPGTFPFHCRGHIRYALSDKGLSILLRLISRDYRPMPAGIGFHPYFPRPPGTRLRFEAICVWPADAPEAVATGCQPLVDGLSFREGPDVSAMVVDRLYEGWDGRAELIASDGFRTIIEADGALDKLQIYSAWYYPYVCVEPVSNANDGFNRMALGVPSHGVRVLEPNRLIEGVIRI
ncbi:MAG: hypothetical protein ACREXT_08710, partial [Gammaproteobacteria bacterium]